MDRKQLIKDVGDYIEKYYIPGMDDIVLDDEQIQGFFDRITDFLSGKSDKKTRHIRKEEDRRETASERIPEDAASAKDSPAKAEDRKFIRPMGKMTVTNRRIDDLMSQMDETFSRRLIRMIHERGMSESEAYKKAFVDRRHFAKIKKDEYYAPGKKTVLAFCLALELTLDETKDLLRSAGYALSRSSKFDIIVVYFLENRIYDMFEINEVLYEYDQPIFE